MTVRSSWEGLRRFLGALWTVGRQSVAELLDDTPFQLAGALSFFTTLSLAPLLLLLVAAVGVLLGEETVREGIGEFVGDQAGPEAAHVVRTVMARAATPERGVAQLVIGGVALVVGATTVFVQLQTALNHMWRVRVAPHTSAVWGLFRSRLLSLVAVVAMGALLLLSILFSAVLNALGAVLAGRVYLPVWLLKGADTLGGLAAGIVFVAVLFKYLPDARVAWRDVWLGAAVTGVLFSVGRYLLALYLGHAGIGSPFGAAGSVVVLLVWIYYASLILLLGAAVTRVHARHCGAAIEPASYATSTADAHRAAGG